VLRPPLGERELAPAHRSLIDLSQRVHRTSAAGEDVHGGAELSEEAELGVVARGSLEVEERDPVGVGVDQG
jgi:hypothetical protein